MGLRGRALDRLWDSWIGSASVLAVRTALRRARPLLRRPRSGARKNSTPTATGCRRASTAMSGGRIRSSAAITTGFRTATALDVAPAVRWTWVGDEPWGWAPYHYGRWSTSKVLVLGAARLRRLGRRSWWAALVAFVYCLRLRRETLMVPPLPHTANRAQLLASRRGADRLRACAATRSITCGARTRSTSAPSRNYPRAISATDIAPKRRGDWRQGDTGRAGARRAAHPPRRRRKFQRRARAHGRAPRGGAIARGEAGRATARRAGSRSVNGRCRAPARVPLDEELRRSRVFNNRERS